jgi:hypothetical protein
VVETCRRISETKESDLCLMKGVSRRISRHEDPTQRVEYREDCGRGFRVTADVPTPVRPTHFSSLWASLENGDCDVTVTFSGPLRLTSGESRTERRNHRLLIGKRAVITGDDSPLIISFATTAPSCVGATDKTVSRQQRSLR